MTCSTTLPTNWQLYNGYPIGPGADLTDADLGFAAPTGANLNGADLTGAVLGFKAPDRCAPDRYNLTRATLYGNSLSGADLTDATLTNVKSSGITSDGSTTLPTNWQLIEGYLIGPGADLTDADLTGADLSGVDLSGATLTNVKSGGITGVLHCLPIGNSLMAT